MLIFLTMCVWEREGKGGRNREGGERKGGIKVAQAGGQLENKYKAFERMV